MTDVLQELRRELAQVVDLQVAARVLEWDQLVMMPPTGSPTRAESLATLHRLAHELFVRDEIGDLLERARPLEADLDPESDDACLIAVTRRDWEKARRVPPELTAEMTKLSSEGMDAWAKARSDNDYASFQPWLDRTLELKRRYIECFPRADDPYDVVLDDFEPGMKTDEVRRVFDRLKPALRELVAATDDEPEEGFVSGSYPASAQHELSVAVARAYGAREESFRLDPTVHPFCSSFSTQDIRLTTRYAEDDLNGNSLFSTMHEVGHGLYEHGGDPALDRTPLATGCSSALHESQSRLWENVIGRSLPFWRWFYPQFQDAFAETLGDVPLERFHRAINRPRPSFIRVDADETTYGLHIILRFELEQELLFGGLSTADLPEAWNARLDELLGITPPENRLGCLQDVHWSGGLFGYFPTYQLGNVLSVQIWERLLVDLPDAYDQVERGSFDEIYEWLRHALYRHGRKFTPGRDDRAGRRRPDRPGAVPPLPRGEERLARRGVAPRPPTGGARRCASARTRTSASTQRRVELRSGVVAQQRERPLDVPRAAVDPRRDERVVDVADREDARLERDLGLGQATRVARPVEPLVVVVDERLHERVEAAELAEQLDSRGRVALDDRELLRRQRRRLLQHGVRDDELADVVQEPACRKAAEPACREPELLADVDREPGDAACVLLGRAVLLRERDEQRTNVRAEERLLCRDEVGAAQVAPERARPMGRAAAEIERDGKPDGGDAADLEPVPEPPADVREVVDERADERGAEPRDPDRRRRGRGSGA